MEVIELTHGSIRQSGAIDSLAAMMVRLTAPFHLRAGGVELIKDDDFPVVELASQLGAWLAGTRRDGFRYRSLESDDEDLLRFERQRTGFTISSSWADTAPVAVAEENLAAAAGGFVKSVADAVREHHVDLADVIDKVVAAESQSGER